MPLSKKEPKWIPDPGTVEMMENTIMLCENHLEKTHTWVEKAEERVKWAKHRLARYRKDGTYIPMYPEFKGEEEVKTK